MKTEKNILIAFILNILFSIFEFIGGLFTNSISIISDSIHDFGDALSIGISYILEKISKKKPNELYTFGYIRYSVFGSLITTIILFIGSLIVITSSIYRLINPEAVNYNGMIIFSIFGIVINFLAMCFTREGNSLNQKSVNLHMLEDVLGWIVVFIGSILMKFTNINLIDPIMSMGVAIFILINAFGNLTNIFNVFLEKTPKNVNISKIKKSLLKIENIENVHHIHVWSLDGFLNYATLHVVSNNNSEELKERVREKMHELNIDHVTIEIESNICKSAECEIKLKENHSHTH